MNKLNYFIEYPTIFSLGGCVYMLLEICWRGFSHWSMGICGGICFLAIYICDSKMKKVNLALKCLAGCLFITLAEFCTGYLVNIVLNWNVWDYSHLKLNIMGQICVLYTLLWFALCFPSFYIARVIKEKIFTSTKK